jgi:hypothetical protein
VPDSYFDRLGGGRMAYEPDLGFACLLARRNLNPLAQTLSTTESLTIHANQSGPTINRDIFGQFAEHLGQGIHGGIWVGKNSKIANRRGIRRDAIRHIA